MSGFLVAALAVQWERECEFWEERGAGPELRDLPRRLRVDDDLAVRYLKAARAGEERAGRGQGGVTPDSEAPGGRAREDERFAAHALLQALLPLLCGLARRDRRADLDDYVAEAWIRIMTFPVTRTRKVCTNIALDCLHVISAGRRRSGREQARTIPDHGVDPWAEAAPGERARDLIDAASRMGIVNRSSRPVLMSVYAEGLGHDRTAQRYTMTPEAVRARCSRATRAMRRHASELAECL